MGDVGVRRDERFVYVLYHHGWKSQRARVSLRYFTRRVLKLWLFYGVRENIISKPFKPFPILNSSLLVLISFCSIIQPHPNARRHYPVYNWTNNLEPRYGILSPTLLYIQEVVRRILQSDVPNLTGTMEGQWRSRLLMEEFEEGNKTLGITYP